MDDQSQACINILELPEEVALHLFSYLSAIELSDCVAKVCTLWREYSRAHQLWKHLDYIVEGGKGIREQVSIFQTASAFRTLVLKDISNLKCILPLLFLHCSSIQDLGISSGEMDPSVLTDISKRYKNSIRSLTLEGMELDKKWCEAASEIAKSLRSLTIKADCCVWAMGLLSVECTALTSLRLTSCCQSEDHRRQMQGVKRMITLLPDGMKTLQLGAHISLNAGIMQAVGEKQRLEVLTLEDCSGILDEDLMSLLSLICLQSLQLWRVHQVTTTGLLNFIYCSKFKNLRQLDLFDCQNLNDEVLQEICIKCGQLESLDISKCHLLTDNGVAHVFQFCSQLHTLKMSFLPQVTGNGYLHQLPEFLPKLIYLDAYNCCNISCNFLSSLENNKLIVLYGRQSSNLRLLI